MFNFVTTFTMKMFCSFGAHCCFPTGMACSVSMCCFCFTWQDSGTLLWLCLFFCKAMGSPAQWPQLALPSGRESDMGKVKKLSEGRNTHEISSFSISCSWSKHVIISKNMLFNFRPMLLLRSWTSLLPPFAALAATGLGAATVLSKYIIVMDCCWLELSYNQLK